MSIFDQIAGARREVRKMAKHFPHTFVEWQVWQRTERELAEAKARRDAAKAEWDRVRGKEQR